MRIKNQREESSMVFFFLSINIHLLWIQRYVFQYEESSRRTLFGWGKMTH